MPTAVRRLHRATLRTRSANDASERAPSLAFRVSNSTIDRSGSRAVAAFAEPAEALAGGLIDRRGSSEEAWHDDVPEARAGMGACVDRVSRGFEHQQSAGNDKSVHDFAPSMSSLGSAPRVSF